MGDPSALWRCRAGRRGGAGRAAAAGGGAGARRGAEGDFRQPPRARELLVAGAGGGNDGPGRENTEVEHKITSQLSVLARPLHLNLSSTEDLKPPLPSGSSTRTSLMLKSNVLSMSSRFGCDVMVMAWSWLWCLAVRGVA